MRSLESAPEGRHYSGIGDAGLELVKDRPDREVASAFVFRLGKIGAMERGCGKLPASPHFSKREGASGRGSEKIDWESGLSQDKGESRCRQSVARVCLVLHPSKAGR